MWKKLVVVLVLAVAERVGVPLPLALSYVVANLAVYGAHDKSMWPLAFFSGLIVDLVFLNTLGVSSIGLLLARGVLVYLQERLGRELVWVLMAVAVVVTLMVEVWSGDGWRWWYGGSSGVMALVWYMLLVRNRNRGGVFVGGR